MEHAIGVRYVLGSALPGSYREPAIASVGEHEPHVVEINDLEKFKQGVQQTRGHEIVHLWRSNLPGPIQAQALPDHPQNPYDISKIDELRAKGYTLATIPEEQAATIVQTYIADPSSRKRLQAVDRRYEQNTVVGDERNKPGEQASEYNRASTGAAHRSVDESAGDETESGSAKTVMRG